MKADSTIDFRKLPDQALVRQRDLLTVLPFSAATLWRRVNSGDFPKPVKINDHMTAWRWKDVRKWLEGVTA